MTKTNLEALILECHEQPTATGKGSAFENLCKQFLRRDPYFRQHLGRPVSWKTWSRKRGGPAQDIGIDLVAPFAADPNKYCAIQCKLRTDNAQIRLDEIASFLASSSAEPFDERILIVSSNGKLGQNARYSLGESLTKFTFLNSYDLHNSAIEWPHKLADLSSVKTSPRKQLYDWQIDAVEDIKTGFSTANRGQLIMPCGTGKTLISLHAALHYAQKNGAVLFCAPSLALIQQTVHEWFGQANFNPVIVCSDRQISRAANPRVQDSEEDLPYSLIDLTIPTPTTNPWELREIYHKLPETRPTVVFCTYHSLQVVCDAQNPGLRRGTIEQHELNLDCKSRYSERPLPIFEIAVADEAHKTVGTLSKTKSTRCFRLIHEASNSKELCVRANRRLYMTATPKMYGERPRRKAESQQKTLYSMDDHRNGVFGHVFHRRTFSWAIENNILSDYKVLILCIDEDECSDSLRNYVQEHGVPEDLFNDVTKMVGYWKAMAKYRMPREHQGRRDTIRSALAFANRIEYSKFITQHFENVINEYRDQSIESRNPTLSCSVRHIDGSHGAKDRQHVLQWLGEEHGKRHESRILSSVRCLSEGVDVPSLDGVIFMQPRKSRVDVVQAVGRVMRRHKTKECGFVILPIVVAPGERDSEAIRRSEEFKVVWQVLDALRAHDDALDIAINTLDENTESQDPSARIQIYNASSEDWINAQGELALTFAEGSLPKAIKAAMVQQCGNRDYLPEWSSHVGTVTRDCAAAIRQKVCSDGNTEMTKVFEDFKYEMQKSLSENVTDEDVYEVLAQQIVTLPVFDALFPQASVEVTVPLARALRNVIDRLCLSSLEQELKPLKNFYERVRRSIPNITSATAKQEFIKHLYENFLKMSNPEKAKQLGIVYTPIEIVDFILRSANWILATEFGKSLDDTDIQILDPFTGTGTFVVRLLQLKLMKQQSMQTKYLSGGIHANEVLLLAYYVAATNIALAYAEAAQEGGESLSYPPALCLADTFAMGRGQDYGLLEEIVDTKENVLQHQRQNDANIMAIVGNPPYSANNANQSYSALDDSIRQHYTSPGLGYVHNTLFDAYIRALRWASERIDPDHGGVIGFVTSGSWLTATTTDGVRRRLEAEFDSIYILNLRGPGVANEGDAGQSVFKGTRVSATVVLLAKQPAGSSSPCTIRVMSCDDGMTREQKLDLIRDQHVGSLMRKFDVVQVNEAFDWVAHRKSTFYKYTALDEVIFDCEPTLKSHHDTFVYNCSKTDLSHNINRVIEDYNNKVRRSRSGRSVNRVSNEFDYKDEDIVRLERFKGDGMVFDETHTTVAHYRPFFKKYLYGDRQLILRPRRCLEIFSNRNGKEPNPAIVFSKKARRLSALMVNVLPDSGLLPSGTMILAERVQHRPVGNGGQMEFDHEGASDGYTNVKDSILKFIARKWPESQKAHLSRRHVFHYIYAVFHHGEYLSLFANNLRHELPRIPFVVEPDVFFELSSMGEELAKMHLMFDTFTPPPPQVAQLSYRGDMIDHAALKDIGEALPETLRLQKVVLRKEPGSGDGSYIQYNENVSIHGIPNEAFEYRLGGKPAVRLLASRLKVVTDRKYPHVVNDPNKFTENPTYWLQVLLNVISLSVQSMRMCKRIEAVDLLGHCE